MEKRHAILLSGFARDYEKTLGALNQNLRTADNVDLFICFWNYKGSRKKGKHKTIKKGKVHQTICLDKDRGFLNIDKMASDYNPTSARIYDLDEITSIVEPLAKIVGHTSAVPNEQRSYYNVTRVALMFYMIRETFLLMQQHEEKNNFKYENVVRARTDFVLGGYYPKVLWEKDYNDIHVGAWNWSGFGKFRLNDHFAISSRENMEAYCKFFDHMDTVSKSFQTNKYKSTRNGKSKAWCPEHMLSIYFHEKGIKWKAWK